ncbi:hypothetical protein FB446DRAFT_731455 [Lentinula raphanica]|nr:hypothetical protein FB446DRAFT_731455 [Lentinula raphanica]
MQTQQAKTHDLSRIFRGSIYCNGSPLHHGLCGESKCCRGGLSSFQDLPSAIGAVAIEESAVSQPLHHPLLAPTLSMLRRFCVHTLNREKIISILPTLLKCKMRKLARIVSRVMQLSCGQLRRHPQFHCIEQSFSHPSTLQLIRHGAYYFIAESSLASKYVAEGILTGFALLPSTDRQRQTVTVSASSF